MNGIERIKAERERQISIEGWTLEHDDNHVLGEMAVAAACYAVNGVPTDTNVVDHNFEDAWPFTDEWDKRERHSRLRQLEIAGALIAAEIDRIIRCGAGILTSKVAPQIDCSNEIGDDQLPNDRDGATKD